MRGTATMYWMQWSRSAGLESGPCLSMMRMQASWVRMVTRWMSAASCGLRRASWEMEGHGGFDGGLRVELGGEGDFEEDVFHDIAAVGTLELERLAA